MQTFEWIFVLVFLAGLVYAEDEKKAAASDLRVVETVLLYQRSGGGWPKNYDRQQRLTAAAATNCRCFARSSAAVCRLRR